MGAKSREGEGRKGIGREDKGKERVKKEKGFDTPGGGGGHPSAKGDPLLATSPGIYFAIERPQNLIYSMPSSASSFDHMLVIV